MAKPTPAEVKRWVEEFYQNVGPIIASVVEKSFITEGMRSPTKDAVRERLDWCWDMAKMLKHELAWSLPRIRDRLSTLLQRHLRGESIDLESEKAVWLPPDGDEFRRSNGGIIIP